jgi:hypothetical protein
MKKITVKSAYVGGTLTGVKGSYVVMTENEARKNGVMKKCITNYAADSSQKLYKLFVTSEYKVIEN